MSENISYIVIIYFLSRISEASQTFYCIFCIITKANNSHEIIYRKYLNVALSSSLSPVKCLGFVKRTWYVISRERNQRLNDEYSVIFLTRDLRWISRFHDAVAFANHASFSYFPGLVMYTLCISMFARNDCAHGKFHMAVKKSRRWYAKTRPKRIIKMRVAVRR